MTQGIFSWVAALTLMILTAIFVVAFSGMLTAEENRPSGKIILVEKAKRVTDAEARKASSSESEKNADGGYNANVSVVDCFDAMQYHYTGGRYDNTPIRFRMLTPETIKPGKKYPLIVWFHGFRESADDNTRQLAHVQLTMEYLAGKDKQDFFMIVTQCPSDNPSWENSISYEGQGDTLLTITDEIFETVLQEYPIDLDRLSIVGICSGGNAAWNFLEKHPNRFAAMVVCSALPSGNLHNFLSTPIWAFNNKDDVTTPYEPVEQFINRLNAAGGNAQLTAGRYGRHDTWTSALHDEKAVGWLLLHDLKKGGPPAGAKFYHRNTGIVFVLFGLPMIGILIVVNTRPKHLKK